MKFNPEYLCENKFGIQIGKILDNTYKNNNNEQSINYEKKININVKFVCIKRMKSIESIIHHTIKYILECFIVKNENTVNT